MSADAQRYATVAQGFTARLSGVGPAQWTSATPCSEWTVADLVVHVINTQRRVLALLEGTEVIEVDPEGDLQAQWSESTAALLAAVSDPERAGKEVSGFMGTVPFGTLVGGLACSDTVVHTWDLARATGQDEQLDAAAVEHSAAMLAGIGDAMRRPGGFADALPAPPDADAQTAFLLYCGRAV
jgi:uncharacterized protein (TIGR03086 family)